MSRMYRSVFAAASLLLALQAHAKVDIQHWQTSAGTDVYFVENHDLPIIDISTNFAAGSARDTKPKAGLAALTRPSLTISRGREGLWLCTESSAEVTPLPLRERGGGEG